jgi:hypothetical protein
MKELAEMPPVGLFDFDPEPAYNIAPMRGLVLCDSGRPIDRSATHSVPDTSERIGRNDTR